MSSLCCGDMKAGGLYSGQRGRLLPSDDGESRLLHTEAGSWFQCLDAPLPLVYRLLLN